MTCNHNYEILKDGDEYYRIILSNLKSITHIISEHKNRQIDENRKISRRVDELENKTSDVIDELYQCIFDLNKRVTHSENKGTSSKTPHKCPVCDGYGQRESCNQVCLCTKCEGKGIVWSY